MDGFKKKNKNRKGQVVFISLMLGVLLFVIGFALAPALNQVITGDDVMNSSQLDCFNESISNQNKAVCTQTDAIQPLWFGVVLGLAGILLGRVLL